VPDLPPTERSVAGQQDISELSGEDAERSHQESLDDLEPLLRQVEFVREFVIAGSDASTLPSAHSLDLGFDEAKSLASLSDRSVAIIRGSVTAQTYFATARVEFGTAQLHCYAIADVQVDEVLIGDIAPDITVVTSACPALHLETPVLTHSSSDPPIFQGREYFLFLKPGDDSDWDVTGFPEGHSEAGAHYHLGDPSAHFEIIDGQTKAAEFAPDWARSLSDQSIASFTGFVNDPSTAPEPPSTDAQAP
jgi:hypothetical protein